MNGMAALRSSYPALGSAMFVVAGIALVLPFVTLGDVSSHMLLHIIVMSVVAPVLAVIGALLPARRKASSGLLWAVTAAQIILLWIWHLPPAHHLAASSSNDQAPGHCGRSRRYLCLR